MFNNEQCRFVLPTKFGDRLVAFVLASVLTGFFAVIDVNLEKETATGWLGKLLHGLAVEAMFTFSIFSALALVWALFTPRWLESLVTRILRKVVTTIAVILTATALTILYYTL